MLINLMRSRPSTGIFNFKMKCSTDEKYFIAWLLGAVNPPGFAQSFKKLHQKAIVVDTHNDVLSSWVLAGKDISKRLATGHTDLVRWKEGGLDVQFFSVYTGPDARNKEGVYKDANEQIDSLERHCKAK